MFSLEEFADDVAKLCYRRFNLLPKNGKPQLNKEWTLLAAIVMSLDKKLQLVSLATGTKCLGVTQLDKNGNLVSDSHAEILARRGLLRFLYHHMHLVLNNKVSNVLYFNDTFQKFIVQDGIKFHLFISHVPCGDAAIFPKSPIGDMCLLTCVNSSRNDTGERCEKRLKTNTHEIGGNSVEIKSLDSINIKQEDIYRTGAKCVENETQDPKLAGAGFHAIGALRTKPGRGDPTCSMSCSDKIALWNVCGLQGALLSSLLMRPIYMGLLVIGKGPFNADAARRAIVDRLSDVTELPDNYFLNKPLILQSSLAFEFSKENATKDNLSVTPCPSSIIWCDVPSSLEVSVNGRKQGITQKNLTRLTSRISVCRSVFFEKFIEIKKLLHKNSIEATANQRKRRRDTEDDDDVVVSPALKRALRTRVLRIVLQRDPEVEELARATIAVRTQTSEDLNYLDYKVSAEPYQEAKKAVLKIFKNWKKKPEFFQKFKIPEKK